MAWNSGLNYLLIESISLDSLESSKKFENKNEFRSFTEKFRETWIQFET